MKDVDKKSFEKQLDRLQFIERRLYWLGRFNRRELGERFGIAATMQTQVMNQYKQIAGDTVRYDRFTRAYHPTSDFQPQLTNPINEDFTAALMAGDLQSAVPESKISVLGTPLRHVDGPTVRDVILAIEQGVAIEIEYASMSRDEPSWRWISPHAMGSDGQRWHVRAYCHNDDQYKDFVLGRIIATKGTKDGLGWHEEDKEWHEFVNLEIAPAPGLSPGAKLAIERDFCMTNGKTTLSVRKALRWYVAKQWNLDEEPFEDPRRQQIVLLNPEVLN